MGGFGSIGFVFFFVEKLNLEAMVVVLYNDNGRDYDNNSCFLLRKF